MSSEIDDEAARVREAYRRRATRSLDDRYDYWQPANLFIYQSRERALATLLDREGLLPLTGRRILDAGCGDGGVLVQLLRLGARLEDMHGIDLLEDRVARAREWLPGARIEPGDVQALTYPDSSFDLVLGFTLLSSVVGDAARARVAAEMLRVARPGGCILLYDFRVNPTNRDARPLKPEEVRALFPGRRATFRSGTLAPPLVRALVRAPGGWLACTALEMLPFLRTHFLAAIRA
jgi:SAM-dependent methyltransferase